jgi:hypothetical protein
MVADRCGHVPLVASVRLRRIPKILPWTCTKQRMRLYSETRINYTNAQAEADLEFPDLRAEP